MRILDETIYDGSGRCIYAVGTSSETKPTDNVISGSIYFEVDTSKAYMYNEASHSWVEAKGTVDEAAIEAAVAEWLEAHPEATTTVTDGSITEPKLASALLTKINNSASGVTRLSDEIESIDDRVTVLENGGTDGASPIINTASGAVASFADGSASPARSAVVTLAPAQDLHGYDNPWPAGGGVNKLGNISKFNQTSYGVTYTVQDDGSVKAEGTVSIQTWNYSSFYASMETYGLSVGDTVALSVFGSSDINFAVHFYNDNTLLLAEDANNAPTAVIPEGTNRLRMLIYCKVSNAPTVGEVFNKTIYPQLEKASTPSSVWHPYANICPISGHTGTDIKRSGADTSVYDQLTVTFPSAAGTVYGGTYDFVSGKLIVDRARTEISGGFEKHTSLLNAFYKSNAVSGAKAGDCISNQFPYSTSSLASSLPLGYFTIDSDYTRVALKTDVYSTAADFNAALAQNPLVIVYPLATPIEYDLTPQQLATLLGTNNAWSTNGVNTAIEYKADTKLYIDGKIAELSALIASL